MCNKISESIFSNKDVIIPMEDVQHIKKQYYSSNSADGTVQKGDFSGIIIITKHTKYNTEIDWWENPIYISNIDKKAEEFIKAYCYFRHEKDI